jgi:DNA-directed RNA polymerase subunit RPC12/RpoP
VLAVAGAEEAAALAAIEDAFLGGLDDEARACAQSAIDLDAEVNACPACGARIEGHPPRCPGCGLRIG